MTDKAAFLSLLEYEEIPRSNLIRLTDDFRVHSAVINRDITVPAGFVCDGESVFFKSSTEAGVVHDYLYRRDSDPLVSRRIADDIFYEMSEIDGSRVSWLKWAAVRLFSGRFYHKQSVRNVPNG